MLAVQSQRSTVAPGFESSTSVNSIVLTTAQSAYELERAAAERWERIALLPGLDLIVRADAKEPARLVAQRICEAYSVKWSNVGVTTPTASLVTVLRTTT